MIAVNGFDSYRTYLAIKQHFNNKTYDFFKYNGKVRANPITYESRKDKYFFEKAAKRFKHDDWIDYVISNITQGNEGWVGNMFTGANLINYQKWKKQVESMSYNFENEICIMSDYDGSFNENFKMLEGKHPLAYRLYSRRKLSLETMVILDDLINYTSVWYKYNDIILNEFCDLIKAYRPFLHNRAKIDKNKFKKIIMENFNG